MKGLLCAVLALLATAPTALAQATCQGQSYRDSSPIARGFSKFVPVADREGVIFHAWIDNAASPTSARLVVENSNEHPVLVRFNVELRGRKGSRELVGRCVLIRGHEYAADRNGSTVFAYGAEPMRSVEVGSIRVQKQAAERGGTPKPAPAPRPTGATVGSRPATRPEDVPVDLPVTVAVARTGTAAPPVPVAANRRTAADHAVAAATLRRAGRVEEARAELEAAARRDPRHHAALGDLLMAMRRYPEAESPLRRAARLAPRDAGIAAQLGEALFRQRRWKDAATSYRRAAKLAPNAAQWKTMAERARANERAEARRLAGPRGIPQVIATLLHVVFGVALAGAGLLLVAPVVAAVYLLAILPIVELLRHFVAGRKDSE
ncbi:MAG TPA: tetratricopeptide repeat protein [Longimicrobium sp.]|nr:tetratricopeptide repeat protein [Longimicrobium sp.]